MKITVVSVSEPALKYLRQAAQELKEADLDLSLFDVSRMPSSGELEQLRSAVAAADLAFYDMMGAHPKAISALEKGLAACQGERVPFGSSSRSFLRLGDFDGSAMAQNSTEKAPSPEKMRKMQNMAESLGRVLPGKMRDMRHYTLLCKYFRYPTAANLRNFLLLILREYGAQHQLPKAAPPYISPAVAFYELPSGQALSWEEVKKQDERRGTSLIVFSPDKYPNDLSPAVAYLQKAMSQVSACYVIGLSGDFCDQEADLRTLVQKLPGGVDLILNTKPFRLGAGPMGGNFEAGVQFLKDIDVPYLHPFTLSYREEREWKDSVEGGTPGENLISIMLPELDGALDSLPFAARRDTELGLIAEETAERKLQAWEISDPEAPEVEVSAQELPEVEAALKKSSKGEESGPCAIKAIEERCEYIAARAAGYLRLRHLANSEKRIAILLYNYPPGEANIFGGAFLDTFTSVSVLLATLCQEGYRTEALSVDELAGVFTAGRAVNSGEYPLNWEKAIFYPAEKLQSRPEIDESYGKKPGEIMVKDQSFFIPGIVVGNVFIGLQPSRGRGDDDSAAIHDKTQPPHHQYLAFYQWLREEFRADALIHVGTHGTLEFLKGKETAPDEFSYPSALVGTLPHFYLYYCGNPAEAMIAKRRSLATLVSYQAPPFRECGLYGDLMTLNESVQDLRQAEKVNPRAAGTALRLVREKAKKLHLPEDIDELEHELYRLQKSLIPYGLHVLGQGYSEEERETFRQQWLKRNEEAGLNPAESERLAAAAAHGAAGNAERENLLRALGGHYIPVRLAGDIYRSPDILPSGFNLVQFDPRRIPTATAMARGKQIAEQTLAQYRAAHEGRYPETVALILWGLETSRTQGETIGQILTYLGVKLSAESSVWDIRFDIIPLSQLRRPRIDVSINICGFFRDMFPLLLEKMDDLFHELALLDEKDEDNYLAAHARKFTQELRHDRTPEEAEKIAASRFFGPRPGEYGTSLTKLVEDKSWQTEADFSDHFTADLSYLYGRDLHGTAARDFYQENLRQVGFVSQLRTMQEYEVTDLDHYYEFFGGLAKSVESAKGHKVPLYITDTTGQNPESETVDKAIARGIRSRALNPEWVDGLLRHRFHGAQAIQQRLENIMGLAATTAAVDQWIYHDLASTYVEDQEMARRVAENNPYAYKAMLEQFMEYYQRGYWKADEEQLAQIRERFLELEDKIEASLSLN